MPIFRTLLSNPHTTIAGGVYLVAKFGVSIAAIRFPELKEKLSATSEQIEGMAVAYGLFAAGDANRGQIQPKEPESKP
jgi:hypothetical protein